MDNPELITAATLQEARRIVVFTGAGMSAESGIATFRDQPDSLWAQFNTRCVRYARCSK